MQMGDKSLDALIAISRERALSPLESLRLERAMRRTAEPKGQKLWTSSDLRRLRAYLSRGKKPAQIAPMLGRTERAIWRKIYKEKLSVGLLCPAEIYTASRLRVQSRSKR
jgi:hypothetical protein